MRQAGRYLPEYRAVRQRTESFLKLCFTPKLAAEITLQPIRRFGFDAAIVFSDILVVPHALGQRVTFETGGGPRLDALTDSASFGRLQRRLDHEVLAPIYETLGLVKQALPRGVALLGFCGAPWTLATYMIAGCGTAEQVPARLFAYRYPQAFAELIDLLVETSASYLIRQLEAGADAVQIFDTWAGVLPAGEFEKWCIVPCARLIAAVRQRIASAKVIGFPRGAGSALARYVASVPVDAVGLDWMIDPTFAREQVQKHRPIQGNLDPLALLAGGDAVDRAVDKVLENFGAGPLIFNLGHGVLPDTPTAHVARLVARVRGGPGEH